MTAWIAALFVLCVGTSTYVPDPRVVLAVDRVAHAHPLFTGDDALLRTTVLLVSISHREGHLNPEASSTDAYGEAVGLGQIHETNFKRLGVTRTDMLDPEKNLEATATLLEESLRICRDSPPEERLAEYAAGRGDCTSREAVADSRNRVALAEYLLRARRPTWVEPDVLLTKPSHERH
jgi:membrane-bound lytic murein transglycosylase MltF